MEECHRDIVFPFPIDGLVVACRQKKMAYYEKKWRWVTMTESDKFRVL